MAPRCLFLLLAVCCVGRFARADDAQWSAGVSAVKITPDKPLVLSGYAARTKPFEKVDQDIWAKALALRDGRGHRAVLVTMDLTILPPDVGRQVRQRIEEQTKLDPADVVLSVSHTHSAPTVSLHPNPNGKEDERGNADTIEYTRGLEDKLVSAAVQALADLKPSKLSWGTGVASFVMNRREFTDHGVILGVNPRGLVDRSVPVLRIDGEDGMPRIILFGYACHNTTLPSNYLAVSGDYAGYAKVYVQEHVPGAEALFMMGCGGDANPYPREQIPAARAHGEELGKEVCRVIETNLKPVRGPLTCATKDADLPLETPDRNTLEEIAAHGPGLKKEDAGHMLASLGKGQSLPPAHRAPVGVWQFGQDLTLVTLPDEVVVGYVPRIEQAIGPLRLWVAAYCQEVAGYIPTRQILNEGGYETRGLYIGSGWFKPDVEDVLVGAVEDVVKAARK